MKQKRPQQIRRIPAESDDEEIEEIFDKLLGMISWIQCVLSCQIQVKIRHLQIRKMLKAKELPLDFLTSKVS